MEFESPAFRRSCSTGDRDDAGATVMRLRLTTAPGNRRVARSMQVAEGSIIGDTGVSR
jgi:hypothetical protein